MKRTLSEDDRKRLDAKISEVEKRTDTQVVLALIQRSDNYPELPWKAFALGSAFTGLLIFILDLLLYGWDPGLNVPVSVVGVLFVGALFALLTVLIPCFARRFLSSDRAEVETTQYAESLFLSREIFATSKRRGILLMVSVFERKVIILPDKGLTSQLSEEVLLKIIQSMTPYLKQSEISQAFETGLAQLSQKLRPDGKRTSDNELSDEIIEEKGV